MNTSDERTITLKLLALAIEPELMTFLEVEAQRRGVSVSNLALAMLRGMAKAMIDVGAAQ